MAPTFRSDPAMDYLGRIGAIRTLFKDADYIGIQRIDAAERLETFLPRFFAYRPALIRLLYRLRAPLVRLLGFSQEPMPPREEWLPEDFPMLPCGNVWFFTVQRVKRDRYWIAGCPQGRHLDAELAVVAQPLGARRRRFHIVTTVHYRHWTGPLYFNLIRGFNLALVYLMSRAITGRCPPFPLARRKPCQRRP